MKGSWGKQLGQELNSVQLGVVFNELRNTCRQGHRLVGAGNMQEHALFANGGAFSVAFLPIRRSFLPNPATSPR